MTETQLNDSIRAPNELPGGSLAPAISGESLAIV